MFTFSSTAKSLAAMLVFLSMTVTYVHASRYNSRKPVFMDAEKEPVFVDAEKEPVFVDAEKEPVFVDEYTAYNLKADSPYLQPDDEGRTILSALGKPLFQQTLSEGSLQCATAGCPGTCVRTLDRTKGWTLREGPYKGETNYVSTTMCSKCKTSPWKSNAHYYEATLVHVYTQTGKHVPQLKIKIGQTAVLSKENGEIRVFERAPKLEGRAGRLAFNSEMGLRGRVKKTRRRLPGLKFDDFVDNLEDSRPIMMNKLRYLAKPETLVKFCQNVVKKENMALDEEAICEAFRQERHAKEAQAASENLHTQRLLREEAETEAQKRMDDPKFKQTLNSFQQSIQKHRPDMMDDKDMKTLSDPKEKASVRSDAILEFCTKIYESTLGVVAPWRQ